MDSPDDHPERLAPGSVPGWGLSWWLAEEGLLDSWPHMEMKARFEHLCRYGRALGKGWRPQVAREEWVGPHDPHRPAG